MLVAQLVKDSKKIIFYLIITKRSWFKGLYIRLIIRNIDIGLLRFQ